MPSKAKINFKILKVEQGIARLSVVSSGKHAKYDVQIVDRGGIFGVEFPSELALMLHGFPKESKDLISEIKALNDGK